jgi:hypothetical protein
MNRSLLRRLITGSGYDDLLDALTTRQHVAPHEPLARALAVLTEKLGVCPTAVEQAVTWLGVDPKIAVGRLRRTELTQLARSIHRIWRQHAAAATAAT